ncbi:MAG: MBL fold metallo-hydrolase, partial [Chloroflexi bacterium]|nr:MBL fold metallo-hydrolase [Chloroflexota bacterium]
LYAYPWQGQGNNCNTYAVKYSVDGTARFAVVDPGHRAVVTPVMAGWGRAQKAFEEPGLEALLARMAGDGIKPDQVGLVLATHGHADHMEAALELRQKGCARMAVHQADAAAFARTLARYRRNGPAPGKEERQPDLFLVEGMLELGWPETVSLQVLHTPGHTPGSVSLWWAEKKALFTGDTVFYRSVGRTDIQGGDPASLAQSVKRLSELPAEYLLTGHAYGHPGLIQGATEVRRNFELINAEVLPYLR